MRSLLLSALFLATVLLLSSALPQDKGKDGHKKLLGSDEVIQNEKSLQRRKPPGIPPGPKLTSEERDSGSLAENPNNRESKMKHLSDEDRNKKGKKNAYLKKDKNSGKNYDFDRLNDDSRGRRNKNRGRGSLERDN